MKSMVPKQQKTFGTSGMKHLDKLLYNICEFLNVVHIYADEARWGETRAVESHRCCSHVRKGTSMLKGTGELNTLCDSFELGSSRSQHPSLLCPETDLRLLGLHRCLTYN